MKVADFVTNEKGVSGFEPYMERYREDLEMVPITGHPTYENLDKLKESGCEGLLYWAPNMENESYYKKLADMGIKYICCTSAGFDHFNLPAMKKYGIKGANVPFYSPNAIAEHAVLLGLSLLRNFREQILRIEDNTYDISGLMGREMRNMTAGIIGTGRIGFTAIKCLSGFGPKKMYAYDIYPREEVKEYAEYVSLDELLEKCDMIFLHCVYNDGNFHMINAENIKKMKDGVMLVNAARGPLLDTRAVIAAVNSGKIGGLAMDVIEWEERLGEKPHFDECPIPELMELLKHKNVIFTNHTAFYTDEAHKNMMETTLENMAEYARTGECCHELVK